MKNTIGTRDIGLAIGLVLGRYFLKSDDLHFGYWTPELEVKAGNLPAAQEKYSEFLTSHIGSLGKDCKHVLDVGCGTGNLAKRLIGLGYKVDCVSPSLFLTQEASKKLGIGVQIYACKFEDFPEEKQYDLILFSESYQYIDLKTSFLKSLQLLRDNGHMLICDFFKKDAPGKSALSGGHRWSKFQNILATHKQFAIVKDIDITLQTAPNMDLINDVLLNVGVPIRDIMDQHLQSSRPFITRILKSFFRGKIEKLDKKYFQGQRTAKNFAKYKTYRLLLLKKSAP